MSILILWISQLTLVWLGSTYLSFPIRESRNFYPILVHSICRFTDFSEVTTKQGNFDDGINVKKDKASTNVVL